MEELIYAQGLGGIRVGHVFVVPARAFEVLTPSEHTP
jgi:hypothetical protein